MACPYTGKEQFPTFAAAYKRIRLLESRKRDRHDDKFSRGPLTAYRCRSCSQVHCGHKAPDRSRYVLAQAREARYG